MGRLAVVDTAVGRVASAAVAARRIPRLAIVFGALAVIVALAGPWISSGYWVRVFTSVFMFAALAQSVNFIAGYAGYADFGNVLYFGIGAYVTGFATSHGLPFPLALLGGVAVAGAVAVVIGRPILRLRGHYFAIATIGMLEGTRELVNNLAFLGGGAGLNLPIVDLPPRQFSALIYYAMLGLAVGISALSFAVRRSSLGYGLRAIKADEQAAAVMGINTTHYKTVAWALAATCSAAVGSVYAVWHGFIEPGGAFDVVTGTQYFMMMLLGGPATVVGPLVGAFGLALLDVLVWGQWQRGHLAVLGALIIAVVIFLPGGFVSAWETRGFTASRLLRRPRALRRTP